MDLCVNESDEAAFRLINVLRLVKLIKATFGFCNGCLQSQASMLLISHQKHDKQARRKGRNA